ncbi:hypothetical protein JG688_00005464 [Phytophthora aleatoria]|uniref:Uncharacterized protein n=1 Tax=Phytophthora aleatoria TaxID=2496075 RepID=A0A8J5M8K0_9STRA|nr:hypothetical protein JG688_00005464 [Phytophthora aleatoria]
MAFATLALRKGSRCILSPGECKARLAGKLGSGPAFANTTRVCYGYACSHPYEDNEVKEENGGPDAEEEDDDDATKDAYGARRREPRCGEERQNSNAEERDESSNAEKKDERMRKMRDPTRRSRAADRLVALPARCLTTVQSRN